MLSLIVLGILALLMAIGCAVLAWLFLRDEYLYCGECQEWIHYDKIRAHQDAIHMGAVYLEQRP